MDKPFGDKLKLTDEYMKLEIAQELGLIDKILDGGWKSLTSKESGRIGGLLSARKRLKQTNKPPLK